MKKPQLQAIVLDVLHQSGVSKADILHDLGYAPKNIKKALQRLENALQDPYLGVCSGSYDFVFSDSEFLRKLIARLGIAIDEQELSAFIEDGCRYAILQSPFVSVQTDFVRQGQSLLTLGAMHSWLRIRLPKNWVYFDRSELDMHLNEVIENHYSQNDGKLPMWGNITGYKYHAPDGTISNAIDAEELRAGQFEACVAGKAGLNVRTGY